MQAPSLDDQRAFYGDALGLPVVADTAEEVAFQAGRTRIGFREAPAGAAPTYHFALRVPGNQFAEAKSWLAARAALLREDAEDEFDWDFWGALAVYVEDPARNIVELIAFPGLPPAADGEFGPASILGVAELGFPVADVPAAVSELRDAFGIGLWDRDHVSPNGLTPVGEQGATFIIVSVGRTWFLGDVAAAFPLEVTLGGIPRQRLALASHPYVLRGVP